MNLDELVGYDRFRDIGQNSRSITSRKTTLVSRLSELGFTVLDAGTFASVLTHPKLPYVIKLFRTDPCYIDFVRLAQHHSDNHHFPRFIGKPISLPTDPEIFGIRMEKLKPIAPDLEVFVDKCDAVLR